MMDASDFPIISKANTHTWPGVGFGYVGRDYSEHPLGEGLMAGAPIKRYTMKEIGEIAEEKTAKGLWMTQRCDRLGMHIKYQNGFSFCWNYAVTRCIEICYAIQGGTPKVLSGQQNACLINGYRDQGGYGARAAKYATDHGVCLERLWPTNSMSRSNDNEESRANALLHRIHECDDMDPRDRELIYSCIVDDIPVSVGVPAWSHEVAITFLAKKGSVWLPGIDNSHGPQYGKNGRGVLDGQYNHFSEAIGIRSVTPSVN